MKLPSLFKIPSHQRFNYTPRYYDEIKEDIQERTERIRRELEQEGVLERSGNEQETGEYKSRISGSFSRRAQYRKSVNRSSLIQFGIFILLMGGFVGYLFYGSDVIYGFLLLVPLYAFLRLKKIL